MSTTIPAFRPQNATPPAARFDLSLAATVGQAKGQDGSTGSIHKFTDVDSRVAYVNSILDDKTHPATVTTYQVGSDFFVVVEPIVDGDTNSSFARAEERADNEIGPGRRFSSSTSRRLVRSEFPASMEPPVDLSPR